MSVKTESEQLFEELCNECGWVYEPVDIAKSRTPDYDLYIRDEKVVVEVKQINANNSDKMAKAALERGEPVSLDCPPGKRIRQKITDSRAQIRSRTAATYPSLLVLYSNVFISDYTDPYHVRVGMYGFEAIELNVPRNYEESPSISDRKFGRNKRMTESHNTSFGGLGILRMDIESNIYMFIYHNVYAAIPLSKELLENKYVRQFTLSDRVPGEFQEWVEI